jgi:hypothetical protein
VVNTLARHLEGALREDCPWVSRRCAHASWHGWKPSSQRRRNSTSSRQCGVRRVVCSRC